MSDQPKQCIKIDGTRYEIIPSLQKQANDNLMLKMDAERRLKIAERERDELLAVLKDCVESLSRLPNGEGAYRVTCLTQARAAIARATEGGTGQ